MHAEVVKPALKFLADPDYSGPNAEFLTAHEHYRHGRYASCLVECNKAFESTMKVICEMQGWPFDNDRDGARRLIIKCKDNGLFPPFQQAALTHVVGVLETAVPTTRNRRAAHGGGAAPIIVPASLAAYGLHMAAANILLLIEAEKALP
ncbi:MAG: hypothetical protein ACI9OJ_000302 [Myxococcota bacterium]|jgi:hypothetical protein